ncbi:MAG: hypothetical protein WC378_17730, partial [Opitutaceae bacterium]
FGQVLAVGDWLSAIGETHRGNLVARRRPPISLLASGFWPPAAFRRRNASALNNFLMLWPSQLIRGGRVRGVSCGHENTGHPACRTRDTRMNDVIFIIVTLAFFGLSLAYVYFCDRVR